ncbi:tripartite tricarboxylate transporter TctB family protein [Microvirga sp. GCM10011540]|uniref:tripartite tricarboxylate transporter TctB family protein n=1 Tax=Microvirga sp. GCM10011540 TaxID=3317338 RepID=UPI0036071281
MQSLRNERRAWPIGATIFALAVAASFAGYAFDVVSKARGATDSMMIVPAAGIGIAALIAAVIEDWRAPARRHDAYEAAAGKAQDIRALSFMAALAVYVAAIPFAGFDIASFVFLATALLIQGERRPIVVLGFSLACAVVVVWTFVSALDVPLPTILL